MKCEAGRAFITFFAMNLINTIIQEQITLKSHFWRKSYYFSFCRHPCYGCHNVARKYVRAMLHIH